MQTATSSSVPMEASVATAKGPLSALTIHPENIQPSHLYNPGLSHHQSNPGSSRYTCMTKPSWKSYVKLQTSRSLTHPHYSARGYLPLARLLSANSSSLSELCGGLGKERRAFERRTSETASSGRSFGGPAPAQRSGAGSKWTRK